MAEPISAWLVTTFAMGTKAAAIVANLIVYAGSTLLSRMLGKSRMRESGIQTAYTVTGDTVPQSFILGRYATAGHHAMPPNSHGDARKYLNYVVGLSDLPIQSVRRVIIDDKYSTIGDDAGEYGFPLLAYRADGVDYAWIRTYDGRQTTADAMLVAKYGEDPDRPWSSTNVAPNTAYAVLTFLYNAELFSGLPQVRFEVEGLRLYDPRKDSSVGGSGRHRFNNPTTWEYTENPVVMIYNIMRGITLPTGEVWGGRVAAADLPLDDWNAAANACDEPFGGRTTYVAGLEVYIDESPAVVIEELAKACFAQIAEVNGRFRIRVGSVGASVMTITDDDLSISDARDYMPFPGLSSTFNAIFAEHPSPANLWRNKAITPITNATYETQDGGRQLPVRMAYNAVRVGGQARQLALAYQRDGRRTLSHNIVLPPEAAVLEPLDAIRWTSALNGYSSKIFEVTQIVDRPNTIMQEVVIRERDPSDLDPDLSLELPAAADPTVTRPNAFVLANLAVTASTIGGSRALTITWTAEPFMRDMQIEYKIRIQATGVQVARASAPAEDGETIHIGGIVSGTTYEAQARLLADYPTAFTAWVTIAA